MQYSEFQQAIFDFVTGSAGNASIEAVAGSGKTTTIVEAANRLPKNINSLFLAFNKSIAEELASRLPSNVEAKTLNGLGHRAWMKHLGKNLSLDTAKTRNLMRDHMSDYENRAYGGSVAKLVSLAKSSGIVPRRVSEFQGLLVDSMEVWEELIDLHDIDLTPEDREQRFRKKRSSEQEDERSRLKENIELVAELARDILTESIYQSLDGRIDFDDQIYMTVVAQAPMTPYDFIFVDEAQDLNVTQRAMLRQALRPASRVKSAGRLVAVGDPHQAIYGFRGADSGSMENLKRDFDAVTLPLSISYRCPQAIVTEAQRFVRHIQSHPTAPQGTVGRLDVFSAETFRDDDVILCRNTRYLIEMAFNLIRDKKRCKVLGRDIGKGLKNIVAKMNAFTVEELIDRLDSYEQRERDRLLSKGMDEKAAGVTDRVETIRVFIEKLPENDRSLERLNTEIDNLFSDPRKDCLMLATIHKSKGMEWNRVFILNGYLMPSKYAVQPWQLAQETNLQYVAVTRAKSELYYIDSTAFQKAVKALPEQDSRQTAGGQDVLASSSLPATPVSKEG